MRRNIWILALCIALVAIILFYFADRQLQKSVPVTDPQVVTSIPQEIRVVEVNRTPFQLPEGPVKVEGRELLWSQSEFQSLWQISVTTGFQSALGVTLVSQAKSHKVSAVILQLNMWTDALSLYLRLREIPADMHLVLLSDYILLARPLLSSDKWAFLVAAIAQNLRAEIMENRYLPVPGRCQGVEAQDFEYAELPIIPGVSCKLGSGLELVLIKHQDFADRIQEQVPVRPFSIGSVAVQRLLSRREDSTVYLRTQGPLVYLLPGYSRNPGFQQRLEILNALFGL